MFHRALPEVAGFGVITSMPGLTKSSQPLMCLGLPLRTTSAATESEGTPFEPTVSQLLETIPLLTRRVTSGVVEKATTSAGWPDATARLCAPDGPNDWVNETPLPADDCAKAAVSLSYAFLGVE